MTASENAMKILQLLLDAQKASAPIELSIGHVSESRQVQHGTVVLKSAPPSVIEKLMEEGYSLSMSTVGLEVFKIN